MKVDRIFYLSIVLMLICVSPVYSQEQSVVKLQLPAIPQEEDIVSLDLTHRIALNESQKRFGKGVIGKPIVGYDLNGSVRAYIVPFKIGGGVFPPEEEIIKQMNEAKQLLPEAKRELAKIREASLKRKKPMFEKRGDRVVSEKDPEWKQAEERIKELEDKCWGIGDFGTVVISGRKDLVPVLEFSNSLPYYYTYREPVEEKAKEALGSSSIFLTRFYYGSEMDQIFEFESPIGDKIWVAIFPLRVVILSEITAKKLEVTEEEKRWIQRKWSEVLKEVQNEK